jgi:hypothetical protein
MKRGRQITGTNRSKEWEKNNNTRINIKQMEGE